MPFLYALGFSSTNLRILYYKDIFKCLAWLSDCFAETRNKPNIFAWGNIPIVENY